MSLKKKLKMITIASGIEANEKLRDKAWEKSKQEHLLAYQKAYFKSIAATYDEHIRDLKDALLK